MTRTRIGIIADDLTGAADTGVAFLSAGMPASVRFARPGLVQELAAFNVGAVAVDAATRGREPEWAQFMTAALTRGFADAGFDILYKKIDSLLRGHVATEVGAAVEGWGRGSVAIVAPAFPAVGRTTIDGRVLVDGRPPVGSPRIADVFAAVGRVQTIGLDEVRGARLTARLGEIAAGGGVVVCDAETDADLMAIALAGLRATTPIVWVGAGGLAHAVARALPGASPAGPPRRQHIRGPILAVVGSMTAIAQAQAQRVAAEGVTHVRVSPADITGMTLPMRVNAAFDRSEDVLVTIETPVPVEGEGHAHLVSQLGVALAPSVLRCVGGLVLTGGDTATGMLQALECTGLDLVAEIEPGVVSSTTAGPRAWSVVTKSGSFGVAATLATAVRHLRGLRE